tara:strand:- start:713 stop:1981 length:1269 start_codon:yes stop_codon:yes gene_type:complete
MSIKAIIGGQWGDEGKGKIVDLLSRDSHIVARYQGGANAGHTVYYNDKKLVLHQIPSGILRENCKCILGNGMVVDPIDLVEEINMVKDHGVSIENKIFIALNTHIVTPITKYIDCYNEEKNNQKIGTTGRGIGPTYVDKYNRIGIRALDLLNIKSLNQKLDNALKEAQTTYNLDESKTLDLKEKNLEFISCSKLISQYVSDTFTILHNQVNANDNILIEGAQGTLLDVDHGTYPYVTSSNASSSGIATGLGLPMTKVNNIIGIFKAYTTRVGEGPFPTELFDSDGKQLQDVGKEYGATTGRPRRCGWFDGVAAKYSCMVNGLTDIALTKLDILDHFDTIKICTGYEIDNKTTNCFSEVLHNLDKVKPIYTEFDGWKSTTTGIENFNDLPDNTKKYIDYIINFTKTPINIISVGPGRNQIIKL